MRRRGIWAALITPSWIASCLTLPAGCAAIAQESPGEALGKIERTLSEASTISAKIKVTVKVTGGESEYVYTILLKRGNKVVYETLYPPPDSPAAPHVGIMLKQVKPVDGGPLRRLTVSDGKRMQSYLGGRVLDRERDALKDYGKLVTFALARGGVSWAPDDYLGRTNWPELEFDKALAVSNVNYGPEEGGTKTLTYQLKLLKYPKEPGPECFVNVNVMYDAKTYRPLKRILAQEGKSNSTTETFEEFVLNGDIADNKFSIPSKLSSPHPSQEEFILSALRSFRDAEEDFRENDRDNNKVNDYWVGDVSGLYRFRLDGQEIREIPLELALADGAPLETAELSPLVGKPVPTHGYLFMAIKKLEKDGKVQPYDNGSHRNTSAYAIVAYPADYPVTGTMSFIINAAGSIFKRDAGGIITEIFPEYPAKYDWKRVP